MIKKFHKRMLGIAKSHRLPEHFKDDLDQDLQILTSFDKCRFIWLLRTSGTVLFPLEMGADPIIVSHWLHSDHDQKKVAFFVDPKKDAIEMISFEITEKLIFKAPTELSTYKSWQEIEQEVCHVINSGINKGVWGIFENPKIKSDDWEGCRSFYNNSNNRLMTSYMDKAIHLRKKLIQSSRAAA
jgi:hypothetical protein